MVGKKKGFTASQSKRMSRRMESSTIGTHVAHSASSGARRGSRASGSRANASQVEFSNARRHAAAQRGYVSQVGMASSTGESDNAYSRRVARLSYAQEIQRKARRRRMTFVLVVVAVALAVAAGVGVTTFFGSADSKLSLGSSNAKEALVAAKEGEPYYVLCSAELGSAGKARGAQTDAYLLVRVDESARMLTYVNIPANLDVTLSDGKSHPLYDAREVGGDAELITQVAKLAEVDIAHFVATDATGLAGMVDAVGGVSVDVPEEIDDPYAGTKVIPAGQRTLDGQEALVFLRATNFATGFEMTASNRVSFTMALASAALSSEGLSFASLVGDAGSYVSTDWTSSQLMSLGDAVRPLDQMTVYSCYVAGYETSGEDALFEVSSSEWAAMLEHVKAGEDPNAIDSSITAVNPADVSVEVRNGSGVTGAAARMGDILTSAGYVVEGVGNVTDGVSYPETLVIYKDAANEGAAKAIVRAASGGRVVNGGDFYELSTDVLVIVGKDWMPVS